jgi:hypothetical protein
MAALGTEDITRDTVHNGNNNSSLKQKLQTTSFKAQYLRSTFGTKFARCLRSTWILGIIKKIWIH